MIYQNQMQVELYVTSSLAACEGNQTWPDLSSEEKLRNDCSKVSESLFGKADTTAEQSSSRIKIPL